MNSRATTTTRVVVESSSRGPGESADDYTVDLGEPVRGAVSASLVWTNVRGGGGRRVHAGNSSIDVRRADGSVTSHTIAEGGVASASDLATAVDAALPPDIACTLDGERLRLSCSSEFRVDPSSSARRLLGMHPTGTDTSTSVLMPYAPDMTDEPYLNLSVDPVVPSSAWTGRAGRTFLASVPCDGFERGYGSTGFARGTISRIRVRFETAGGFRYDFGGMEHALALDLETRACSRA